MTQKTYSIAKILEGLQKEDKAWEVVPGVFVMNQARVENAIVTSIPNSLVLKCFINPKTGEIKMYLAKLLDDETETIFLP